MFNRITDNPADNNVIHTNITRTLEKIGVTIPERDAGPELTITPHDLPTAVREAVAAGKDPAADKKVREQLTRKLLYDSINVYALIELDQSKARVQHLINHADSIIDQLKDSFSEAVATIREHAKEIPGDPEKFDPHDRPAVNVARAEVIPALARATAITGSWGMIFPVLTGGSPSSGPLGFVTWCEPTWAQVVEHKLRNSRLDNGRPFDVWEAIARNIPISLATDSTQVRTRMDRIEQQKQDEMRRSREGAFDMGLTR